MGFFRSLFSQQPREPGYDSTDLSTDLTTADARRKQLHRFAEVSDELSAFYTRNDKTSMAAWCDKLGNDARGLLSGGFEEAQLKNLALSIPRGSPDYSDNPKAVDSGWREERWQREERTLLGALQQVAMELRAIRPSTAE